MRGMSTGRRVAGHGGEWQLAIRGDPRLLVRDPLGSMAGWTRRRPAAAGDARRQLAGAVPDVLLSLDEEYGAILALLDRAAAVERIVAGVPELAGVDVAWVGEPGGEDEIVLGHSVNTATNVVEGLIVPVGAGLGGRVMAARRPLWVSDYYTSSDITHEYSSQAATEGIQAMIAVPILHDNQLLGVLYGANRERTQFGDRTAQALEQLATRMATAQVVAERARHAADVAAHEERRRLALELHDTVGAMLFTLGAGIRRLGAEPGLDSQVRTRLSTIEQQAVEATAALRGSLRVLSAPPEQVALGVAVREHCRAFSDRANISARMITLSDLPALARSRIRALADAVREALLNVEKHARAQSVVVSIFALRDGVAVTVTDDGVGLDDSVSLGEGSSRNAGLGLAATSDRLARLGGTLSVASNDDGGVTVQAWVPA
jgi:signal transduction histidine kinase